VTDRARRLAVGLARAGIEPRPIVRLEAFLALIDDGAPDDELVTEVVEWVRGILAEAKAREIAEAAIAAAVATA
jgi:hypothetical protein